MRLLLAAAGRWPTVAGANATAGQDGRRLFGQPDLRLLALLRSASIAGPVPDGEIHFTVPVKPAHGRL